MSNAFWKEEYKWMSPEQWECFGMLCDLFGGAHHVRGIIRPCGANGIEINAHNCSNQFGTFDFSGLTRAVVMAHDRMIRFSIEPSGPKMLKLSFNKRSAREGRMHERHPTIETAIATIRGDK